MLRDGSRKRSREREPDTRRESHRDMDSRRRRSSSRDGGGGGRGDSPPRHRGRRDSGSPPRRRRRDDSPPARRGGRDEGANGKWQHDKADRPAEVRRNVSPEAQLPACPAGAARL